MAPLAPIADGLIPLPPPGKAQVVFFRPSAFMGMAIYYAIRENGASYGNLSSGKYLVAVVEPGAHTFTAKTEATEQIILEVDPGETAFVQGGVSMGVMVWRPALTLASQEAFEPVAHRLKLAAPPSPEKAAVASAR